MPDGVYEFVLHGADRWLGLDSARAFSELRSGRTQRDFISRSRESSADAAGPTDARRFALLTHLKI
jgi:hypothetical protein